MPHTGGREKYAMIKKEKRGILFINEIYHNNIIYICDINISSKSCLARSHSISEINHLQHTPLEYS